jgi:hypothetical protein
LLTFPAPSSLWGKPVSQVFSILCQADTILLGIIRAPNKRLGNVLPFAYACPKSTSIVSQEDSLQTLSCHDESVIMKKLLATVSVHKVSGISDSLQSHDSERLLVDLVAKLATQVKDIHASIRKLPHLQ